MKTMKEYISTAEGVEQMWEKINDILDNFDFNKVKSVMTVLDWSWACNSYDGEYYEEFGCRVLRNEKTGEICAYYPECPQLIKNARQRLLDAVKSCPDDETRWGTSCGGFKVTADILTDKERLEYDSASPDDFKHSVDLSLSFIVEESQSY